MQDSSRLPFKSFVFYVCVCFIRLQITSKVVAYNAGLGTDYFIVTTFTLPPCGSSNIMHWLWPGSPICLPKKTLKKNFEKNKWFPWAFWWNLFEFFCNGDLPMTFARPRFARRSLAPLKFSVAPLKFSGLLVWFHQKEKQSPKHNSITARTRSYSSSS